MRIFVLLLLLCPFTSMAQPCSSLSEPGRIPDNAVAVCGTLTFHQAAVQTCTAPDIPDNSCALAITSGRSVWYKFHCYTGGTLGFLITPASLADDYDWVLMDYTGHPPGDVLIMNLDISVNISGITGTTGCTAAGVGNLNCEGNTNPYNQMPTLIAGHDYLLMVTNWSNSGIGYDIDLNGGSAILTNNVPPTVSSVGTIGCNTTDVKIVFSEDILCSSLTANGSEFTITNGTHVISSISSACNSTVNGFTELTLTLQTALTPGNYNLVVNDGTDLNTLLDICQTALTAGSSFPFTVPALPALAVNNVVYSGCAPTILKVALTTPVLCNTVTATGSEFSITPGNPVITAVQSLCSSGSLYADTLQIILQDPLPHGNYQLVVNNGSDANTFTDTCGVALVAGYQFPFVITQTTPPAVQSIFFDGCKPFKLLINFDKPILCSSLSANADEFIITPELFTVTGSSTTCDAFGLTSQVTLTLSGNLPTGNFNLNIRNGSDGNTIRDSCFSYIPVNTSVPFVTIRTMPPVYDSVQYDKCTPSLIKVFYNKAVDCRTIDSQGSEFYITGPATTNVISATPDITCSNGFYSHWVLLQLDQPITVFGTYVLHNRWGVDNNSLTDTCYTNQDTTETISFNVLGKPAAATFTNNIHWGCVEDTLELSHPGGNGINSWTWNFSDATSASGQNITHTFPVSTVTATVELIVSNGYCSDTLQRTYTLDNAISAAFSTTDTTCILSNVSFINNSTGNNLQWLWQFGDNTTFNGQSPPLHPYTTDGDFNIGLIITNDHGCSDTAEKMINITKMPLVDFSGLNAQYCTGEAVTLTANLQLGNISSYTWNTGSGNIFQDDPAINYTYYVQGNYTVSLNVTDRFCPSVKKDSATKVYFVPSFDLGKDKTLCPGLTIQIGLDAFPGLTYLWSNGSTSPRIITAPQSGTYHLIVNNNGCTAEDEININMLANCLIRVPSAFTPNRDGLNDRLKAINADLATNFSLKVYNRFGQLLFFTKNPLEGWDGNFKGNPADTGTYVWQLSYTDPVSKKPVYEKGTSILIR